MRIILIVAVAQNGVIGWQNRIPWRLRSDLRLFRQLTMGYPLIMGRKTFDSLPGVLPGRTHIVLSRQAGAMLNNPEVGKSVFFVKSPEEARQKAISLAEKAFLIGGAELYECFLQQNWLDEAYVSRVEASPLGDTYFDLSWLSKGWKLAESIYFPCSADDEYAFYWQHWQRLPD